MDYGLILPKNKSETASAFAEAVSVPLNASDNKQGNALEELEDDVYFLSVDDIVQLHNEVMQRYTPKEPRGLRDAALLESAVFGPQQTFFGQFLYASIEEMAAAYLIGLAQNHAFEQGNKRVAYGVCWEFLNRNGYELTLTQKEAIDLTLRVVNGQIERDEVAEIIANSSAPIE